MSAPAGSAKEEWSKYWYLPVVSALGYSASGLHMYGIGPFLEPLQKEFGWNRTQTMSGLAMVSVVVALASIPMGALIDRVGPRRIGLLGVLLMGAAVALLSTATGTMANWSLLWLIVSICAVPVQGVVWISAVVSRFDAGRGLALAVALSGASFGSFTLPLVSTALVETVGWRGAFLGLGAIWGLTLFPLLYFCFRGAQDDSRETRRKAHAAAGDLPGVTRAEALRDPVFYQLIFASGLFALCLLGAVVHFVPILVDSGATPLTAASAAALIGIFSLIGRLATGAVLDRFPGHIVGAVSFLLPIPGCALLLVDEAGIVGYFVAAAMFGLTVGAEMDVITYLATRRFGLKHFGAIQGAILCAIAVGAAAGPLVAAALYDRFGSYTVFLACTAVLMLVSAVVIGTVRTGSNRFALNAAAE